MYGIIEKAYIDFLNHEDIQFFDKKNKFWLILNDTIGIVEEGIYYSNQLCLWEEFDENYINNICSSIPNSKQYNLRLFLNSVYQNKNDKKSVSYMTDSEAFALLKECRKEIKELSAELEFYSIVKFHVENLKVAGLSTMSELK